jgi:hypothetical protein
VTGRSWAVLAAGALGVLAAAVSSAPVRPPPLLLSLSSPHGTSSRIVVLEGAAQVAEWPALSHAPDGHPRGVVLGPRSAAVVVEQLQRADPSWSAALWVLEPGGHRLRADRVYPGTRPVVLPGGALAVPRGRFGPAPAEGAYRVDLLSVEAVAASGSAAPRSLWEGQGFLALPIGHGRGELFIYAPGPAASPLFAVSLETRAVRALSEDLPLARDFSLAPDGRLYFTQHGGHGPDDWRVKVLDVASGARRELTGAGGHLALLPWASAGGVLVQFDAVGNAAWRDGAEGMLRCGLGKGVDAWRASSSDGRWMAGTHEAPSDFPRAVVADVRARAQLPLPFPGDARPEVLGFLEGGAP